VNYLKITHIARLWKKLNENILTETYLKSLAKYHNVSVYRKEHFKNDDTISIQMFIIQKVLTKYEYQVKEKVFHDDIDQIFCSSEFDLERSKGKGYTRAVKRLICATSLSCVFLFSLNN